MLGTLWSQVRNHLYDKRLLPVFRSSSFVISIGNLTWGGTGKTQLTMQMASHFLQQGLRVAVISRGYKRRSSGFQLVSDSSGIHHTWQTAGDEPFLMARKVSGLTVMVDADRSRALQRLESNPPDLVILDDGFQHRKVFRDVDIVLVDGSENLGKQRVIPFGKLREPISSLSRADAVVMTHSEQSDPETRNVVRRFTEAPVFQADCVPVSTPWQRKRVAAFCGIGAPHHFFRMLQKTGAELVFSRAFPDHHVYSDSELKEIEREAQRKGAEFIVTTEKDSVKLSFHSLRLPFYAAQVELKFRPEDEFYRWLNRLLPRG